MKPHQQVYHPKEEVTDATIKQSSTTRKSLHGVLLKNFEQVVADILTSSSSKVNENVVPRYLPLPALPKSKLDFISSSIIHKSCKTAKIDNEHSITNDNATVKQQKQQLPPTEWPFTILPYAACVRSSTTKKEECMQSLLGKLSGLRAIRKEHQLRSIIQCVLAMLPYTAFGPENDTKQQENRIKIVDFAGGTGHLAIPIALLLPKCDVINVDLKASSLELMHQKALFITKQPPSPHNRMTETTPSSFYATTQSMKANANSKNSTTAKNKKQKNKRFHKSKSAVDVTQHNNKIRQCDNIPNLYTFHGSISNYINRKPCLDIGIALHACGEATDHVLRACGGQQASFIISPCCVGKLNRYKSNPYIYHATSTNEPTISYPQSSIVCQSLQQQDSSEKFDILAKAADYSDMNDMRTCRNATRRTAKSLLEMDRLLFMKEMYQYDHVVLSRMVPWEASPKNDILMGWMEITTSNNDKLRTMKDPYENSHGNVKNVPPCLECNADVIMTIKQLVSSNNDDIPKVLLCQEVGQENTNDKSSNDKSIISKSSLNNNKKYLSGDSVDWTMKEEEEYTKILLDFIQNKTTTCDGAIENVGGGAMNVKKFPKGMGSRKRKLVHYIAEKMKLRHWCEGKRQSEKIVVVGANY